MLLGSLLRADGVGLGSSVHMPLGAEVYSFERDDLKMEVTAMIEAATCLILQH